MLNSGALSFPPKRGSTPRRTYAVRLTSDHTSAVVRMPIHPRALRKHRRIEVAWAKRCRMFFFSVFHGRRKTTTTLQTYYGPRQNNMDSACLV